MAEKFNINIKKFTFWNIIPQVAKFRHQKKNTHKSDSKNF
jgi:hypothetical protein